MKVIKSQQLTSNEFVNKLLLLNTKFNDCVNAGALSGEPHFEQFLIFLKREFDNKRLAKDELIDLLDNYFHILDHLHDLTPTDMLFLIKLDYHLESLAKHYDTEIHIEIARKGACLEKFVHHSDPRVRIEVARHGYRLDVLMNDVDPNVRIEVARHGYRLDLFLNDEHRNVREEVAKHRYGLVVLVNDIDRNVREQVATQNYRLDLLIHDKDQYVREEAISREHGLRCLLHDENQYVRAIAKCLLQTRHL